MRSHKIHRSLNHLQMLARSKQNQNGLVELHKGADNLFETQLQNTKWLKLRIQSSCHLLLHQNFFFDCCNLWVEVVIVYHLPFFGFLGSLKLLLVPLPIHVPLMAILIGAGDITKVAAQIGAFHTQCSNFLLVSLAINVCLQQRVKEQAKNRKKVSLT